MPEKKDIEEAARMAYRAYRDWLDADGFDNDYLDLMTDAMLELGLALGADEEDE